LTSADLLCDLIMCFLSGTLFPVSQLCVAGMLSLG
jgi:hypothetical protein